ncbi:MAG TPA: SRPBCC family protein [Terrimicrobiaceae bacterium]|nr:SRPBCC family protein [Terrimicrobiaceae bacterium]
MRVHLLETQTMIPATRREVFGFFSDASNLERITPPSLGFTIRTPLPICMEEGALIDYTILLHGLPMRWRTRISVWNPPSEFIDEQLIGPYKKWIHHHTFEEVAGKTLMRDRVDYALPFSPFGDLVLPWVRNELRGIFEFRRQAILSIFPDH